MRVLRGRGTDPESDRQLTHDLVDRAVDTATPALRVWTPHRVVAFGRRDTGREGCPRAKRIAAEHGYTPVERAVGGRAVAFTGSTVAFVQATPESDGRASIEKRYEQTSDALASALERLGVPVEPGEPDGAFCPGTHSLSADGKIAGLAQRVRREIAVVSGVVVVRDHEQIGAVLDPVYEALDIPFDAETVGSIARAGGEGSPETVTRTVERALTSGRTVELREA